MRSPEDKNELSMQEIYCIQDSDYDKLLAEKEKALDVLCKKLSEAENKILELSSTVESHANCTSVLREMKLMLHPLQEQLPSIEEFKLENVAVMEKNAMLLHLKEKLPADKMVAHFEATPEITSVIGSHSQVVEKEMHSQCMQSHRDKDALLLYLEGKLAADEIFAVFKLTPEYISAIGQHMSEETENNAGGESKANNSVITKDLDEVKEDILKHKLNKSEVELIEMKRINEELAVCANPLKQEETVICLNNELAIGQMTLASMEGKYSLLNDVLSNKDLEIEIIKEKCNDMINEVTKCAELKEVHAKCTDMLKEKEHLISVLQQELINSGKYLTEVEEKSFEISREKEASLKLLQEMRSEIEKKKAEIERMKEVNEINTEALKQKNEDILLLEEKLSGKELFITELEADHGDMSNALKSKEELIVLLQKELKETAKKQEETVICLKNELAITQMLLASMEGKYFLLNDVLSNKDLDIEVIKEKCNDMINEVTMFAELKEVHAKCTDMLKEKEHLISSLQQELINSGKYWAEVEEKSFEISREKEESLKLLQEMRSEIEKKKAEIERMKEVNEINTEALKQKNEDILLLEEKLSGKELLITELEADHGDMSNALKSKEESLVLLQEELKEIAKKQKEVVICLKNELAVSRRSLASMEGKYSLLTDVLSNKDLDIEVMKEKCNDMINDVTMFAELKQVHAKCTDMLKEKEHLISSLQKDGACSKRELEVLLNENGTLMKTCKELEDSLKEYETSLKQLRCENVNLKSELQEKEHLISSLQQELINSSKYLAELNKKSFEVSRENEESLKLLQEMRSEIGKKKAEIERMKEVNEINTEPLKQKNEDILLLEEKLSRKETFITKLEANHIDMANALESKEVSLILLQEELKETAKKQEETVICLKNELADSWRSLANMEGKYSLLKDVLSNKDLEIEVIKEKCNDMTNEVTKFAELKEVHAKCTDMLKEKEHLISALQQELINSGKYLTEVEEKSFEISREKEESLELLQETRSEIEKKKAEIKRMKEANEINSEALKQKNEDILLLEEKLSRKETLITELEANHIDMTNAMKGKEESLVLLQEELKETAKKQEEVVICLKNELAVSQRSLASMEGKYSLLTDVLSNKDLDIEVMKEKCNDMINEVTMFAELKEVHAKCTDMLKEKEHLISSLQKDGACSKRELEVLENENGTLMKTCKELEDSLKEYETSLKQLRCENVNLKSELQEKEHLISSLQQELINSSKYLAELKKKSFEMSRENEESLKLLQEMKSEIEKKKAEIERMKEVNEINTEALKQKNEDILLLEEKLSGKKLFITELEADQVDMSNALKSKEESLVLLQEELKETAKKQEEVVICLKNELAVSQRSLASMEGKYSLLNDVLSNKDLEIEVIKEKCNAMINEVAMFAELKEVHAKCTDMLKKKEHLISSLQQELINSGKYLTEVEEKSYEISREKEESLKLLQEMRSEIEKKTAEIERMKEGNEISTAALKQKNEDILLLEEKLSRKETFLTELEAKHIDMANALKGKEVSLVLLQEELKETAKKQEEIVICLKNELAVSRRSLASMEGKYSLLNDVLSNKDLEIEVIKEKCNAMINEVTIFAELKEVHAKCTDMLKEKEHLISVLQQELINSGKYLTEVEEKSFEISREKEASLKLLQETRSEIEKKKKAEIERMKEGNEISTAALKQKNEEILSLEEKPSSKEKFITDLEADHCSMGNAMKNKEASLIMLQGELKEAAKLKEICLAYTEFEQERELPEILLKQMMHVKEMEEKLAALTSNLKEKEEIISSQQEMLRAAENKILEGKLICTICSDIKGNCLSEQEHLVHQETAESEIHKMALKEMKEHLQTDNDVLVTNLGENVMPSVNLRDKRVFNVQQGGPAEAKNDGLQMSVNVGDISIWAEESVLPQTDQLFSEKILSAEEIEQNCSVLINNLAESALSIILFKEALDDLKMEMESIHLNMECTELKETGIILDTLKQTVTCWEKEISQYKKMLGAEVKYLSYKVKLLTKKENFVPELGLYIAKNRVAGAELTTPFSESRKELEAEFHNHVSSENGAKPVPSALEWDAMIKNRQSLQHERINYQHLYEGETVRLYEELDKMQMISSISSPSFTHIYPANAPSQVQYSHVSEKMLTEFEKRKSNNFGPETISNDPFSQGSTYNKTELEMLANENAALMKTCKELEGSLKEYETSLKQLRCENVNLTSELQDKTQEIYYVRKTLVKEISSLNPKLKSALKEHCLQKLLSTLLLSVVEKQRELHKELEDHFSNLKNELDKQHVNSYKLKDSWIKELELEVEQLNKQLVLLESRKVPMNQDSGDILKLKEEDPKLAKKNLCLEEDITSLQQQMEAEPETGKQRTENLISTMSRMQSDLDCKDKIIMELQVENETKSCELENVIKRNNLLECNLKAMEEKLNDLEEMKLALLQELEKKCNEERDQKDILNFECERNQILTVQIEQFRTDIENISQRNALLTEQKEMLEQSLKKHQNEIDKVWHTEQDFSDRMFSKIDAMEEELDFIREEAINGETIFQQQKLKFEEKIEELEHNADSKIARKISLLEEIEENENKSRKVTELQLQILYEKVSDLGNKNSALAEEVKIKHEMELLLTSKLSTAMEKLQTVGNHFAQVTAEKEGIIQRNEELLRRNMQLELQWDSLQKSKMQTHALLDIVEKELKTLKEKVIARKVTMVKVHTVDQPCETTQQAQSQNSSNLLTYEQEFISKVHEGIQEINEYLSQNDTYREEVENIRHENNVLCEELEACKVALEAEKEKAAQLEKETSAHTETITHLEYRLHQLCETEKEIEHYKNCLKHEQHERRMLAHGLTDLKSSLESSKSKNDVLYNHARQLQLHLKELRDRNEHLELETNGAAHQIAQLQEEIKELKEAKIAAAEKCQCTTLSEEVIQLRNEASEKAAWEQRYNAERRQCQQFETYIKLYKEKVSKLKAELHKIHDSEQKKCKAKLVNVGVQVDEIKQWRGTSETPAGVVREYAEFEFKIEKYKELCRYRMQKIRNLEAKIQELEDPHSKLQEPSGVQRNDKMGSKENQEDVALSRPLSENVIANSLHRTSKKK